MSKQTKQLLKENTQLEKELTKENEAIMTDLVCYIRASNISIYHQEQIRSDLINMLLDGQAQDRSAYDIFGNDFQQFCDNIIRELPQIHIVHRILIMLGHTCLYIGILGVILLVRTSITASLRGVFPLLTFSISDIFTMVLILTISIAFVQYICKTAIADVDKRKMGILLFSGCLLALLAFCLSVFIFPDASISISFFVLLPFLLVLFIGSRMIDQLYE